MQDRIVVMARAILLVLAVAAAGQFASVLEVPGGALPAVSIASAAEGPDLDVEVDIDREGDAWYRNPIWIAIFVLGALIIIVLIIMAARGGGTAPPRA